MGRSAEAWGAVNEADGEGPHRTSKLKSMTEKRHKPHEYKLHGYSGPGNSGSSGHKEQEDYSHGEIWVGFPEEGI